MSGLIDIGDLLSDPDFVQEFVVLRSAGAFDDGGVFQSTTTRVPMTGSIQAAGHKDTYQDATGDVIRGELVVYTEEIIYTTGEGRPAQGNIADKVVWHGQNHRVMTVDDWSDYGYYKAICVRERGS